MSPTGPQPASVDKTPTPAAGPPRRTRPPDNPNNPGDFNMILTISTTRKPADDLGYLLHKHPGKTQSFDLSAGTAHVFYTESNADRCTAALLLDIDPVKLVRGAGTMIQDYVNDRPYVSSSLMSVAIGRVFGTAMNGTCKDRPEAAKTPMPLTATAAAVPCRSDDLLERLFKPLGYSVTTTDGPRHEGEGRYWNLTLEATTTLSTLLKHIYVMLPVADNRKHYWFGDAEIENLMRKGSGWLDAHPEKALILRRFLGHRKSLTAEAGRRLDAENRPETPDEEVPRGDGAPERETPNLHRTAARVDRRDAGRRQRRLCSGPRVRRGKAAPPLDRESPLHAPHRRRPVGPIARDRPAAPEEGPGGREPGRVKLIQSALTFRDSRIEDHDAAVLVEVIEHIEPQRLDTVEEVLFGCAKPRVVIMTTPNREYNPLFEGLREGALRHRDHKFEWTRAEFKAWAEKAASRYGYTPWSSGASANPTRSSGRRHRPEYSNDANSNPRLGADPDDRPDRRRQIHLRPQALPRERDPRVRPLPRRFSATTPET